MESSMTRALHLILLVALAAKAHGGKAYVQYSPREFFKNYALSSCIADAYDADQIKLDASSAAAGYLELGEGPLEAFTEATILGREFLRRTYQGKKETSYNMLKCIDLFHSAELDSLADRYFKGS